MLRCPGFLSQDECRLVRQAMDAGTVEAAEVLGEGAGRQPHVRNALLVDPAIEVIDRVEARLESCRDLVAASLRLTLGPREGAGFIRYPPGGYFRLHCDRGSDPRWEGAARRAASLVIFLNSSRAQSEQGEFDGGLLRLCETDGEINVTPEAGLLVAFPSDVLHEVTPVSGGTRDTIVDWFYFAPPHKTGAGLATFGR